MTRAGPLTEGTRTYLAEVRGRHSLDRIREAVDALGGRRALVLGDLIVDEYCYCHVSGTVSKAPVIAAVYESTRRMTGGGAVVARHLRQYTAEVEYVCAVGDRDGQADFVRHVLATEGITTRFFTWPDSHTVTKRRYLTSGYPNPLSRSLDDRTSTVRLFEIGYMPTGVLPAEVESQVAAYLDDCLARFDLVVVADFGHGLLTQELSEVVLSRARWWSVNAQTNSTNFGFNRVTKYRGPDFVCVDELEARLPSGSRTRRLEEVIAQLQAELGCGALMVTRGADGLLLARGGNISYAPALAIDVVDTVGSGDAVLSIASLCRVAEIADDLTAFLSASAGAVATSVVGNESPVRKEWLLDFATRALCAEP